MGPAGNCSGSITNWYLPAEFPISEPDVSLPVTFVFALGATTTFPKASPQKIAYNGKERFIRNSSSEILSQQLRNYTGAPQPPVKTLLTLHDISESPPPLRRARFLHDLPVAFFIERRAPRRKLSQRMMLLPHQIRAKRQRLAHAPLVQIALLHRIGREIRIRQRPASDPHKLNIALRQISRPGVDRVLLQPAISGPDHRQIGKRALQLARDPEVPVHAEQR